MRRWTGMLLTGCLLLLLTGCCGTVRKPVDPPFVPTLEQLFAISDYVVTVEAVKTLPSRFRKTGAGKDAVTDVVVVVDQVIKGNLKPKEQIQVVQPGGTIRCTTYEVPGARYLQPGSRYLLFLKRYRDGGIHFTSYMQSDYSLDMGDGWVYYGWGPDPDEQPFSVTSLKEMALSVPDRSQEQ